MKYLVTILMLLTATVGANAQKITFTDTVKQTISVDTPSVTLKIPLTNTTVDTLQVAWKRVANDLDASWGGSQICDLNTCYPVATSASPANSFLPPGTGNNITVTFENNHHAGNGHVRLLIYVAGHDSATTAKYVDVFLTVTVSDVKPVDFETVRLYPNPAHDFVLIQNPEGAELSRVEIYSMLGRKVVSQKLQASEEVTKIDMNELQKGIFMVRVFDENNNVVLTKSISHVR